MLDRAKLAPLPERQARNGAADDRDTVHEHPVTADPDLKERLRAAAQAERVGREVDDLRRQVSEPERVAGPPVRPGAEAAGGLGLPGRLVADRPGRASGPLVPRERPARGRVAAPGPARRSGRPVAGRAGLGVHLRAPQPGAPAGPLVPLRRASASAGSRSRAWPASWNAAEDQAGLPFTRMPDPTFVAVAFAWAAGESFAEVVEAEELSGGDFVRNVKQLHRPAPPDR